MKRAFLILILLVSGYSSGQAKSEEKSIVPCAEEDEKVDGQLVLMNVDTPPVYSEGQSEFAVKFFDALAKEVKIPNHHLGHIKVYLSFVVDTKGNLRDFCIKRLSDFDNNDDIEAGVVRALKSAGKWSPGQHDGKIVPVRMIYPIKIRLQK